MARRTVSPNFVDKVSGDAYRAGQREWLKVVGLKVGDTVRVFRKVNSRSLGWNNDWLPEMSRNIGKEMKVVDVNNGCGIQLTPGNLLYPYFAITKVKAKRGRPAKHPYYASPYEQLDEALAEAKAKAVKTGKPVLGAQQRQPTHILLNPDGTWTKIHWANASDPDILFRPEAIIHMESGLCTKNKWGRAYSCYPTPDKVVTRKLSWDEYFLDLATTVSTKSKDRSTPVGAVIVGADHQILSTGFNGFPRGVEDDPEAVPDRYDRPLKYSYTVHAEPNALLNAAMHGIALKGATMYIYGYPPCDRCAGMIRQAGIARVVVRQVKPLADNWKESCATAKEILKESGVVMQILDPQGRQLYWSANGCTTSVTDGWINNPTT